MTRAYKQKLAAVKEKPKDKRSLTANDAEAKKQKMEGAELMEPWPYIC